MTPPAEAPRRAGVVGTGLIGASIGLALRARGWHVSGHDADPVRARAAADAGAVDRIGPDHDAEITFVATPVGVTSVAVADALEATAGLVTDVGSVKAPIVEAVRDPRFVGGHPMAGSEQVGVEGASADLFEGAVWVLTPDDATHDEAYLAVRSVVASLGAEVLAVPAARHDELVALVSHVPHLTAATLMGLADERSEEHGALLRLAAGGFRDMTRIAAGDPGIWPDICVENRTAILAVLDELIERLARTRQVVSDHDRDALLRQLATAQRARRNLPTGVAADAELAVLRIPVPDRLGVLAEVTTLASERGVNILDLEIAHSGEGEQGVLILVVEAVAAGHLHGGLVERGYRPSLRPLE